MAAGRKAQDSGVRHCEVVEHQQVFHTVALKLPALLHRAERLVQLPDCVPETFG